MASTATKRIWYASYECMKSGPFPTVVILGDSERVCPPTVEAWQVFDQVLRLSGFTASSIGYYNCRRISGSTKMSLHAFGLAGDFDPFALGNGFYKGWSKFSWSRTTFTPAQVAHLEKIRTNNGKKVFRWGGWWTTSRDYMHWEIDCSPSDLKTGIDYSTVLGGKQGGAFMLQDGAKGRDVAEWQKMMAMSPFNQDNGNWDPYEEPEGTVAKSLFDGAKFKAGEDGSFGGTATQNTKNVQKALGAGQTGVVTQSLWDAVIRRVYKTGGGITMTQARKEFVRRGVQETTTFK